MISCLSPGKALQDRLFENLRIVENGPGGNHALPVIWGITNYGTFVNNMTMDVFLNRGGQILRDSQRVYRWKNTLVYEFSPEDHQRLVVLASECKAEPCAISILANLFGVGVRNGETSTQSLPPDRLVKALLAHEDLWQRLPVIQCYSRRPVFDADFNLRGPGWHAEQGILVHGPAIVPSVDVVPVGPESCAIDRLPPYTRRLFGEFCWASDADLTNGLAFLLTGFLNNHFIDNPKPIAIIDGNQRGLGKTLFCEVLGRVLDGVDPQRLPLVRDEELEKKLCAILKESQSSLLFFDNVRTTIQSALIEANALNPMLSFRILGQSGNITRPNTYLWVITSNQTSGTEDLISRGLPIRLRYEGNPRERKFTENLLGYATQERMEILGELAGMVIRWKQAGQPLGTCKHRCIRWAQVIGGILQVAGFDQFLANVEEAEAVMDEGLLALSGLAEHVVGRNLRGFFVAGDVPIPRETGMLPREWAQVFIDAEVFREKLADKNPKGRATWVGTFLSGKTDRKVTITTQQGSATATLRRNTVRGDQKRYYFEITDSATEGGFIGPADLKKDDKDGPTDLMKDDKDCPPQEPVVVTQSSTSTGCNPFGGEQGSVNGNNLDWT